MESRRSVAHLLAPILAQYIGISHVYYVVKGLFCTLFGIAQLSLKATLQTPFAEQRLLLEVPVQSCTSIILVVFSNYKRSCYLTHSDLPSIRRWFATVCVYYGPQGPEEVRNESEHSDLVQHRLHALFRAHLVQIGPYKPELLALARAVTRVSKEGRTFLRVVILPLRKVICNVKRSIVVRTIFKIFQRKKYVI